MIESLLPSAVATAETRADLPDAVLFPGEQEAVARAVDGRRREYATVRHCARQAMIALGRPPAAIISGPRREPVWPDGLVGSMTHCAGYRAAAVAVAGGDIVSLGIDAEVHEPLPEGVAELVIRPDEAGPLAELAAGHPDIAWQRVLFSAKESVYKAWFPMTGQWLGFEEARLSFDPDAGTFGAELLVPGPVAGFSGRWLVADGLVLTAVVAGAR